MKRRKEKCLVCGEVVGNDDYLYAEKGAESMVFALCGEHALIVARFLEVSGLFEGISIAWRDALRSRDEWGNDEPTV